MLLSSRNSMSAIMAELPPTQRPTVDDVGRGLVDALAVRLGGAGVAEADARDVAGGDSALLRALGVAE